MDRKPMWLKKNGISSDIHNILDEKDTKLIEPI